MSDLLNLNEKPAAADPDHSAAGERARTLTDRTHGVAESAHPIVYLFVHAIWTVRRREALLARPVRKVLFAHMQKEGEEKGLKIIAVNGVEDHIHCLVQLMPSQNLVQVVKSIKATSARWLNDTKLLAAEFEWEDGYVALSVSPSGVKQVVDYIGKQEEHHKSKTFESELEAFERLKESL